MDQWAAALPCLSPSSFLVVTGSAENTARVLRDVDADLVVVVEAEDRISLCRFNEQVLEGIGGRPYDHIMLIDGNDERGIDVGLLTRSGVAIESVRSHVDDRIGNETIFSRDCPEYFLKLASGERLTVLANHQKARALACPRRPMHDAKHRPGVCEKSTMVSAGRV